LNTHQKPHFDIDISGDDIQCHDKVFCDIIRSLIGCFNDHYGITLSPCRDILIYTSHGYNKRSYHIVVDNYAHSNNKEAEWLYKEVIKRIDYGYHRYIDGSVYHSLQQFRLLWSEKLGSGRPKIFQEEWYIDGNRIEYQYPEKDIENQQHKELLQLSSSLLSFTDGCVILPDKIHHTITTTTTQTILPDIIPTIFNIIKEYTKSDDIPFKVRQINGNLIVLDRIRPSLCWSCGRRHDHENPYVKIDDDKIVFHCRRGKGVVMGTIKEKDVIHDNMLWYQSPINCLNDSYW
jgi:hypothetical protein